MIFRPFYYDDLGCAAYLLGCGTLGKCAVVDARADDVQTYAAFAASKGMRITHVIDTHVHADHRSGGRELARLAPHHRPFYEQLHAQRLEVAEGGGPSGREGRRRSD